MAQTATSQLDFIISLSDRLTGPITGLQNKIDRLTQGTSQAFVNVGVGLAGVMSAGYTVQAALMPAVEMDRAIGEVRSLGVLENDLLQLRNTALDFSVEYGKSATEFVRASYDIQSAISGLSGQELSQFTKASGVLAAATKADTATITNYMGTMYGIFNQQAELMGKANWVNMVAGQTASAVQMFKTTGSEMSQAFTSLGANATAAGIAMHEQIGILGELQATMRGTEAGTKYKAFLAGVGKAQDTLGLSFTDSHDRLLPMVDILEKIKGKFGKTLEVAESDALKTAFGSDEAVSLIKLLMKNVDGLQSKIDQLGDISGLDIAEQMALAQVDAWERFGAAITAVRIGFGATLLPVLNPIIDGLTEAGQTLQRWTQLFPNLTRWVGYGFLVVMTLVASMSALTLMSGLVYGSLTGLKLLVPILTGSLSLLKWAFIGVGFAGKALAFSFSFLLSPVGLIIAAIALVAYGVYQLITHWETCKAALLSIGWINTLVGWVTDAIEWLVQGWGQLTAYLSDVGAFQFILDIFSLLSPGIWLITKAFELLGVCWAYLKKHGAALSQTLLGLPLEWFHSVVSWATDAIGWLVQGWHWLIAALDSIGVLQWVTQVFGWLKTAIDYVALGFNSVGILWEQFKGYLADVGAFEIIMKIFSLLSPGIMLLGKGFQLLGQWWQDLKKTFADIGVFEFLGSIVDWVIEKINRIPGINIEIDKEALKPNIAQLKKPLVSKVPAGGLTSTINNNQQQHAQQTYQTNHIYTQTVDSQFLVNQMEMEAP